MSGKLNTSIKDKLLLLFPYLSEKDRETLNKLIYSNNIRGIISFLTPHKDELYFTIKYDEFMMLTEKDFEKLREESKSISDCLRLRKELVNDFYLDPNSWLEN